MPFSQECNLCLPGQRTGAPGLDLDKVLAGVFREPVLGAKPVSSRLTGSLPCMFGSAWMTCSGKAVGSGGWAEKEMTWEDSPGLCLGWPGSHSEV